jgi:hypothetical protein
MQKKNALGMDPLSWLKEKNKQESQINNPSEPNDDNESNVESEIQEEIVYESDSVTEPLRDDDLDLKNKTLEDETYEPSDVTEAYRKSILGEKAYGFHVKKPREITQKDTNPATAFVIVYTVLLLILGFIVYRDLTKQIDTLNTKLASIEQQVDSGFINYEETNDVW